MTQRPTRTLLLVGMVLALLAAGVAGSGAAGAASVAGAGDGDGTVAVEDSTVTTDETTTAAIRLGAAPDGLQRYNLTVAVADPSVASIDAVEPGDVGGFQVRSRSETAITFRAADLAEAVEPGAGNVSLGAVAVTGGEPGSTELTATVHELQDDSAEQRQPTVDAGTLTITGEDGAADAGNADATGAPDTGPLDDAGAALPGPSIAWIGGAVAALAIAVLAAAAVVRRRRRSRRQPGRL